jgi:hypothetical protein
LARKKRSKIILIIENFFTISPILNFKKFDRLVIKINIFNSRGFIDPKDFLVLFNFEEIPIFDRKIKNLNFCEFEYLISKWREIEITNEIKDLFFPYFLVKKSYFGHFVNKFVLLACNKGKLKINDFEILIKEKNNYITNEIKKNNLIYKNILQLRVGDILIFYTTEK